MIRISAILFLFSSVSLQFAGAQIKSVNYQWESLKIGGGGYVTGIVVHPKDKNLRYIRTDVGGAYRWNEDGQNWIQLFDWLNTEERNLLGVDGLAIDPNNPNRVYAALGRHSYLEGGVYRSEDRGLTWNRLLSAKYESNSSAARWVGECIAVDPNNSKIIYAGTRLQGLWRSRDDGKTWERVADVPAGMSKSPATGIRAMVFDARSKNKSGSDLYVAVPGTGIFSSNNGGQSFLLMDGSPEHPAHLKMVQGRLFVTHLKGVATWTAGKWSDITPQVNRSYVGLAVDETNPDRLVVAMHRQSFHNTIFRSTSGGKTWEAIRTDSAPVKLNSTVPWWPQVWFSSATAGMEFAPGGKGEVYFTDWFGVWHTPNIWEQTTHWDSQEAGHEEVVNLALVAPPSGALVYSGQADVFGFRHTQLQAYPSKRLHKYQEGFSIAVCEQKPAHIAILAAKSWEGAETSLFTSTDHGDNWNARSLPDSSNLGRIAMSASSPEKLVYLRGDGKVYHTADGGSAWAKSVNAPSDAFRVSRIWSVDQPLAADLVSDEFYLFKSGTLYASADAGKSWTPRNAQAIAAADGTIGVVPAPGIKGELWIWLGKNGLWRSPDGGRNFTKINPFNEVTAFTWGAPAPGRKNPTAFCYGRIDNKWGMFRSEDYGKTWLKINNDRHQFPAGVKVIAGDRNTFGQVYVGTGGLGVNYGKPLE